MITETRQSRSRVFYYEEHRPQRRDHLRRRRRRHHTLDNATLDQFRFICIPLRRDESRLDSSSSQSNLTMSKQTYSTMPETFISTRSSTMTTATTPTSASARRVRFNFDDHHHHTLPHRSQLAIECNGNRHSRSTDDIRQSVHRVQVNIPIHQAINPWLNVDSSTKGSSTPKTRYLTSQKIDINRSHQNLSRLQGIAPFVDAELHLNSPSMTNHHQTESDQNQWYRQMYRQLHKPPQDPSEIRRNPYQPTYTFPEEFNGDPDLMEDYIRKSANQTQGHSNYSSTISSSLPRTSNLSQKDDRTNGRRSNGVIQKVLRFDEPYSSSPILSPPFDRFKSTDQCNGSNHYYSSAQNNHFSSNHHSTQPTSSDTEQHTSLYRLAPKRDENPSNGSQKFLNNKQDKFKSTSTDAQICNDLRELINDDRQKRQLRSPLQPIFRALALHNFYAQTSRELPFKKGDIIHVLRRINDDWLEGEHQGIRGIFPLNHVELFPIDPSNQDGQDDSDHQKNESNGEGEAIVKYDFIPQKTFELQLRKGDKVILLRRLDDNWYEGRLNHIEGIFPAAYVETLKEPPDVLSITKSHRIEHVAPPTKQPSPSLSSLNEEIASIPEASLKNTQKCEVIYDYKPQNPDELEIHVGDILHVIEMCDDGWYCGMMEKSKHPQTMEFGTFPGNYVRLLPMENADSLEKKREDSK